MTTDTLMREAAHVAGADSVCAPSRPADIVDGATPGVIVAPTTVEAVAATLKWATAAGRSVVIRGAGTKDAWGRRPRHVDVLLSLARLNQVIAHEDSDLTATVQAGARLRDVNQLLRRRGQWLPWDPPHAAEATIGGILATNDTGPLRHRHGTPRDVVIGLSVVMADGTIAASGGRVVKNVAGYDIGRLMTGSHGSLAAIVTATFKLAPMAQTSRTVVATLQRYGDVSRLVERLQDRQCEPDALDVRVSRDADTTAHARMSLLARYASVPSAVDDAIATTLSCADQTGATCRVIADDEQDGVWTEHDAAAWADMSTVLRLSWRPATFEVAASHLADLTRSLRTEWIGRVAVGSGLLGLAGSSAAHTRIVQELRDTPFFDHVVVVRASSDLRAAVDVWQTPAPQQALWRVLKQACDPTDTLNAGRGPL